MEFATATPSTICGHRVQLDWSGIGHAWRDISRQHIPDSIVEEIEGEILDGGVEECGDFVAGNGLHYRWS